MTFASDGKSVAVTHFQSTALRLGAVTGRELGAIGPHPVTVRRTIASVSGPESPHDCANQCGGTKSRTGCINASVMAA